MDGELRYQSFLQPMIDAGAVQVFLLGSVHTGCSATSVFEARSRAARCGSHPYFLALTTGRDERARTELQDRLEHRSTVPPHTVLVLDHQRFHQWLAGGHRFAMTVVEKAEPLYEKSGLLRDTGKEGYDKVSTEKDDVLFPGNDHCAALSAGFLAGAELFLLRKQYRLAAFMLHQAAEHALHALMVQNTGWHASIHNVERLLRYCQLFCPALATLFYGPDAALLPLLQKAYIDARYRPGYTITEAQTRALLSKVRRLVNGLPTEERIAERNEVLLEEMS